MVEGSRWLQNVLFALYSLFCVAPKMKCLFCSRWRTAGPNQPGCSGLLNGEYRRGRQQPAKQQVVADVPRASTSPPPPASVPSSSLLSVCRRHRPTLPPDAASKSAVIYREARSERHASNVRLPCRHSRCSRASHRLHAA